MEIIFDKKAKKFIEAQDKPTKQRIKKAIEGCFDGRNLIPTLCSMCGNGYGLTLS